MTIGDVKKACNRYVKANNGRRVLGLPVGFQICPALTCHRPDHMQESLARMTRRHCLVAPSSSVHHLHKKEQC